MATSTLSGRSFWVGDWLVLPRLAKIQRGDEAVHVPPRAMAVLVYLAEADGGVASRSDILDAVWPRMAVTQDALSQCIVELRRAFRDDSKSPSVIETIPKVGIRLIAPVTPVKLAPAAGQPTEVVADGTLHGATLEGGKGNPRPAASTTATQPASRPSAPAPAVKDGPLPSIDRNRLASPSYVAVALSVILGLAGGVWYLQQDDEAVLPNSIAVLPFENLSPDPDHAFIAAGLHEEILNQLTNVSTLYVIGQLSMLRYVDTKKSVQEIADELNVQTVLDTSVRYAEGRIRITPILIDAATGRNLWSATYDEEFADIFAIESDVAMQIANALTAEFSSSGQKGSDASLATSLEVYQDTETPPTNSLDAYQAYLRAQSLAGGGNVSADLVLEYLDQAIRLDPNFALAHARKAQWYAGRLISQIGRDAAEPSDWSELERLVRESAETALELDPDMWLAHEALGEMHEYFWRWTEAIREFEIAARTTPRGVRRPYDARGMMADFDLEEAIRKQAEVVSLNPVLDVEHWVLGLFHAYSHNAAAAVDAFRAAVTLNSNAPHLQVWLAHAEGMLGNREGALEVLRRTEQLPIADNSSITIANLAYAYSQNGGRDDALRLFNMLAEKAPDRRHQAGNWALAYLAIGDYDGARDSLEMVIEKIANHEPDAGFLTLRLIRANIYSDPALEGPPFSALRVRLRGR